MAEGRAAVAAENEKLLRPRWDSLNAELGVAAGLHESWWRRLVELHGETVRAYHTLSHLVELYGFFDEYRRQIQDAKAVELAIFFHDAIYSPRAGSPKNEKDSAVLFDRYAQECLPAGNPPGQAKGQLIEKVRRWIELTASHSADENEDNDCKLFLDFDMAVLGKAWPEYEAYSKQIRQEYKHVPHAIFCKARSGFLSATASSSAIFATAAFRDSREKQARENMRRESQLLQEQYDNSGVLSKCFASAVLNPSAKKAGRRCGQGGGAAAAVAGVVFAPKVIAGILAGAAAATAAFGLRLAFGAPYLRFPYPEPREKAGTVVLAGSYNPPHLGHLAMLRYLSKAHEKVYAVIGINPKKKYPTSAYQRQELLRAMLKELEIENVEVVVWTSIIFYFAREVGANVMYRGIRTWEEDGRAEKYLEFQNLAYQLMHGFWPIPTAYLQGDPELTNVSSTLLRNRLSEGQSIDDLVPRGCAAQVVEVYCKGLGT